jgi:hypothetical protein
MNTEQKDLFWFVFVSNSNYWNGLTIEQLNEDKDALYAYDPLWIDLCDHFSTNLIPIEKVRASAFTHFGKNVKYVIEHNFP